MNEKIVIFIITLIAEFFLSVGLIISVIYPNKRLWPPPKKNSWQYWYIWTLFITSTLGVIILGAIDYNSLFLSHWSFTVLGFILISIGSIIELWGMKTLSFHTSLGLKGEFVTTGPYKYSRNPQYIGFIIAILGIIMVSNSILAFITALLEIILFAITPFAEEPWLRKRFKKKYEDYYKKVPRFI